MVATVTTNALEVGKDIWLAPLDPLAISSISHSQVQAAKSTV